MKIKTKWFKTFHAMAMVIWLLLAIPGLTIWKNSIPFVIVMSIWANVAAHFAAWQSARSEDNSTPDDV